MKRLLKLYRETDKSVFLTYILLRLLVIICMVQEILHKNYYNVFFCIFTLILFTIPFFIEKNFKIEIPNLLETIIILFIFSGEILGEVNCFYLTVPHFDTIMHTINGFICCGVGLSLVELLNDNTDKFNLSPFYLVVVAFCFSMTIGVLWEFFEYSNDLFFKTDMQKDTYLASISSVEFNKDGLNQSITIDNIDKTVITYIEDGIKKNITIDKAYLDIGVTDTMKDLIVNFIGAMVFSIFGYIHLNNNSKYKFADGLYIKRKRA